MPIPAKLPTALRALLTRDRDRFFANLPAGEEEQHKWTALVTSALTLLAQHRFSDNVRVADIVRWVAWARVHTSARNSGIDPQTAEGLLRGLLGNEQALDQVSDRIDIEVQLTLIIALAEDTAIDLNPIDSFLADARSYAERVDQEARA